MESAKLFERLLTTTVAKSLIKMRSVVGLRGCFVLRVFLAGALFIEAQQAFSCSFAVGYFYQVTRLRGTVVGTGNYWPLLGYSSYPRWIRQRVKRGNANMRLYDYRWPISVRERQPIATVTTDERGQFDFGSLQEGHYTLVINWAAEYSDQFDVEIKKLPAETSSVEIDVSPVDPDCTGGHEFITYSK
jgi:hypothetical protein